VHKLSSAQIPDIMLQCRICQCYC